MARRKGSGKCADAKAATVGTDVGNPGTEHNYFSRCKASLQHVQWVLLVITAQVERAFTYVLAALRQRAINARYGSKSEGLRVSQRVSLGEKRYVAVLQCDGERFLVGGGVGSVAMLARLKSPIKEGHSFADALHRVDTEHVTIQ